MANSSSGARFPSSSEVSWKYDVFLSFRGSDTRRNFTSHLYAELERAQVSVFRDEEVPKSGDSIVAELGKAIEESKVSIVVLSENYASSSWCLDELLKIMECRSMYGQIVIPVFYHVNPSDVRYQMGSFAEAFQNHEERFKDQRDKVQRWASALRNIANLSGWDAVGFRDDQELIKNIIENTTKCLGTLEVDVEDLPKMNVEEIPEMDMEDVLEAYDGQLENSEVNVAKFHVGIKSRVQELASHLDIGSGGVLLIGIFGVLGIGKTTVAKAMYDQYCIRFDRHCFLNVGDTIKEPNGLISLQKKLQDILKTEIDATKIRRERSVLLIIDGIDEKKQLEQLGINRDRFGSGSRIFIIAKEEALLKQLEVDSTYSPPPMNKQEATELFSLHAFRKCSPDEKYNDHTKTVVSFLGGRPLLLTVIGDGLYGKGMKKWQLLMKYIANEENRIRKELFQYCCSLFPTGSEFRKDELVQLWIAEGFIVDKYIEKMEDTGVSHFNYMKNEGYFLLSRCDSEVDFDLASSMTCNANNLFKINTHKVDVVKKKVFRDYQSRDTGVAVSEKMKSQDDSSLNVIADFIPLYTTFQAKDGVELEEWDKYLRASEMVSGYTTTKLDYFRATDANLNGAHATIRHLSLSFKDVDDICFQNVGKLKELRTLLVLSDRGSSITHVPRDFFWSLKSLRALRLRGTQISELPSSIRNVKELRYLDISYTPIRRLPESITYLHNLQTLKLRGCENFYQLPKDIEKLTKLRHIELDIMRQLDSLPANMGNLTHLQTLSTFLVDKDDGCSIGQLKNLNDLKGALCISRLENVLKVEEAEEASLGNKNCLDKLELRWSYLLSTNKVEQEEILEWLEPHYGLKELQIQYYGGSKLPTWISSPSFVVLVAVTLYKCSNCVLLPAMGQLPALRELSIMEMNELTDISHQFFKNGIADDQAFSAFPKLETLEIDNMLNLKEWKEVQKGDMPCLRKLTMISCPELVTLPPLPSLYSLKHLEFRDCPKLQPSDQLPDSLESLMIVDCSQIKEWFHEGDGEEWSKKHRIIWLDEEEIKLYK